MFHLKIQDRPQLVNYSSKMILKFFCDRNVLHAVKGRPNALWSPPLNRGKSLLKFVLFFVLLSCAHKKPFPGLDKLQATYSSFPVTSDLEGKRSVEN